MLNENNVEFSYNVIIKCVKQQSYKFKLLLLQIVNTNAAGLIGSETLHLKHTQSFNIH